jgi:O-antigen/teichoic acid export membrane protein
MSLKKQAISGVKWTALSTVTNSVLQILQLAILTRFLEPSDFGLMAIVLVVIGISQSFMDMGVSNAIIHYQDVSRERLSSLYWLNVMAGVVLFALVVLLAPLTASFCREPRLVELILCVAVIYLIQPFGEQFRVLLQKDLRFDVIAKCEVTAKLISFVLAVVLAYLGAGVWSLVFGYICNVVVFTLLYVYIGVRIHRPVLRFKKADLEGFLQFGLFQMGQRTVNYFSAQVDKLILGRILGMEMLGYYSLAWQIIFMPLMRINPIVTRVAFPIFSRVQHQRDVLSRYYTKAISILMTVNFPILFGLFIVANELIAVMYGEDYARVAGILRILTIVGLFKAFGNPNGAVFLAKGRADIGFYWNLFWTAVVTVSCYIFAKKFMTPESVAYAQVVVLLVAWIPFYIIHKVAGVDYRPVLKHIGKLTLISAVMVAAIYAVSRLVTADVRIVLAVEVVTGAAVYALLIWRFDRETVLTLFPGKSG